MTAYPMAAVLPVARSRLRMKTAATWLFVLPLLTEGVLPDVVKLEVAGLALLAFAWALAWPLPRRAVERAYSVFAVLALTVVAYVAIGHWPAYAGSPESYDTRAVMWAVSYVTVAVFAVLFFELDLFLRVFWRAATAALWIGVASCAASRLTGHAWLVNPTHGTLRMVGTMTEPAEWAPVLAGVLLLALRRRSWLYVALSLIGLLLADSPVCLLTVAVSVPLFYALAGTWRYRAVLLLALAVAVPSGVLYVQHANTVAMMASGNTAEEAVGRLLSGIQNVGTDGQTGFNSRYEDTTGVLAAVRDNGWEHFGAGPDADATYFRAMHGPGRPVAAVNALWVSVLADFGWGGVVVLGALVAVGAWRVRHYPVMATVLLPLMVASMVNSAIPDWSFAALGVMLYAFSWAAPGQRQERYAGCAEVGPES